MNTNTVEEQIRAKQTYARYVINEALVEFSPENKHRLDLIVDELIEEIFIHFTQHHQAELAEVYREMRKIVDLNTPPHFTREYRDTDRMRDAIMKGINYQAKTRGIDISDKKTDHE